MIPPNDREPPRGMKSFAEAMDGSKFQKSIPTISAVFKDGSILELVYSPE